MSLFQVRADPAMLPELLQGIAASNPELMQLIAQNQQEFSNLLNEVGRILIGFIREIELAEIVEYSIREPSCFPLRAPLTRQTQRRS